MFLASSCPPGGGGVRSIVTDPGSDMGAGDVPHRHV